MMCNKSIIKGLIIEQQITCSHSYYFLMKLDLMHKIFWCECGLLLCLSAFTVRLVHCISHSSLNYTKSFQPYHPRLFLIPVIFTCTTSVSFNKCLIVKLHLQNLVTEEHSSFIKHPNGSLDLYLNPVLLIFERRNLFTLNSMARQSLK